MDLGKNYHLKTETRTQSCKLVRFAQQKKTKKKQMALKRHPNDTKTPPKRHSIDD